MCLLITGCQKKQPDVNLDVTVEGSYFSGLKEGKIIATLVYDDTWITSESNTTYNKDLANLSSLLCTDVYF